MRCANAIVGGLLALTLFGCARERIIAAAQDSIAEEFIGSTLGGTPVQDFIGGLASNAPCHSVTWQMTLMTNRNARQPATFKIAALYHVPTRRNPNVSEDGPKVALSGTWETLRGTKAKPNEIVCRIHAKETGRSLSFAKVGENLLHLLNPDGSLAVGNGGWSYTLNRNDHAEKPGDSALAMNVPDMSYRISPLATDPTVFGVFEGRSPCHGIARELKIPTHAGCIKVKWRVTLYQNAETSAPTTYKIEGSLHRQNPREGTWNIIHGAKTSPSETVYQLNATGSEAPVLLLKGDDNVLFFLNQNREPMVGHAEFSYTLNRVTSK